MELATIFENIRSGAIGRERVAKYLFASDTLRHGVSKVVTNAGGSQDDIQSIFNLAIVQLMKNVMRDSEFIIATNVNSYIFGIVRNLCLQKLRKAAVKTTELDQSMQLEDYKTRIDLQIINDERSTMLNKVLDKLGNKCRQVLMYWSAGYKMAEIAQMLDYSSDVVVRRKKMNCLNQLMQYLDENIRIKKLLAR